MKLPRYPKYKDSGVKWLGEVPEHWEISVLKRMAHTELSNVDKKTADGEASVSLCNYLDVYRNEKITVDLDFMVASASDEQISRLSLQQGDVIITKDSESPEDIGVPAFVSEDLSQVVCGYHLALLRPYAGEADGLYIARAFKSKFLQAQFATSAVGMTRFGLGKYEIENAILPKPSREEQTRIAQFLDYQLDTIDALTKEQEHLIELLKEKRQAIISHAVTKGLNPDAPMKPSGVKWLGEIPAHWEIVRLTTLYREIIEAGNDELPILSVSIHSGVSDRQLDEDELDRKINRSDDVAKYKKVQPGDLVYNMMRAWQGGFGTVMVPGQISPAYVVARPKRDFSSRFIELLLRTPQAIEEIRCHSYGVTDFRLRLYWDNFKIIRVALPPNEEQKEILARIEKMNQKFDQLIEAANSSIATLQERRFALISAAVTGQIDVRGEPNALQ